MDPDRWSGVNPVRYPDAAVRVLDAAFEQYRLRLASVERLATGFRWAEGPVWFGDGRFLLWSDIPNNRVMKWEEQTGAVSVFRVPSNNTNGNTRDRQGRLASDPPFGILGHDEGHPATPELPTSVYRVDGATGEISLVTDAVNRPNGLCFSPDESRLYVVESGVVPRVIRVFTVTGGGTRLTGGDVFVDAGLGVPDGMRCDTDGNLWCGWGGGEGEDGVAIFTPGGDLMGRILLPERCANLCFGGGKRNRLFMAASQSLYSLYVNAQGAVGG